MFGVGPQEMMVIALLALIIFGPGKLPEVMQEAGKHYRKFKGMADEMTGELNKVTAEARKELDGALGDLGPMGKDLEKSLGMGGKKTGTTTSTSKMTAAAKKTTSTSSTAKKTTSTSSSKSTSTSAKKPSDSRTAQATKAVTKTPIASKEDPLADFAVFEPEANKRVRRSRSAAPSAMTDLTPRDTYVESPVEDEKPAVDLSAIEDPLARARARRRNAGYARA